MAAIMAIRVTDTAITRMDTLDHIRTMAIVIMGDLRSTGPVDTGFITVTIATITTAMGTKLTLDKNPLSWLGSDSEPVFLTMIKTFVPGNRTCGVGMKAMKATQP